MFHQNIISNKFDLNLSTTLSSYIDETSLLLFSMFGHRDLVKTKVFTRWDNVSLIFYLILRYLWNPSSFIQYVWPQRSSKNQGIYWMRHCRSDIFLHFQVSMKQVFFYSVCLATEIKLKPRYILDETFYFSSF